MTTAGLSAAAVIEPKSLNAALSALYNNPQLVPMAGCTDLMVGFHFGQLPADRYLNLWGLRELRGIRERRDGSLSIGALTTYSELIGSPVVMESFPILVAAARETGGPQVQNRGTLGGNLANASPAADSVPVLCALDAMLVLKSISGQRRVPVCEFYTDYRKSVRRPDELIVKIEIPKPAGRQWFRKVGTRAANAISKVVAAGVRDGNTIHFALGSVSPTVIRARRTEQAIALGSSIAEAQRVLQTEIEPIDDIRSNAQYRRRVAANLLALFYQQTS